MLEEVLSDKEVAEIQKFIENETLKEAVKKVILYAVYYNGTLKKGEKANPLRNFAISTSEINGVTMSDEKIGQLTRAKKTAIDLIESGYEQLDLLKKKEEKEIKKGNQAR